MMGIVRRAAAWFRRPGVERSSRRARHIALGAGGIGERAGWAVTEFDALDVTRRSDFERLWRPASRHTFLAEHVWEHLTPEQARAATANCYAFLRPGGRLRLAVPDGLHPNSAYIEDVRPGGTGAGADDHKVLYDYRSLSALLRACGFEVELLEHWDEHGKFRRATWDSEEGHVRRSADHDPRNRDGELRYTSLIVDGIRPFRR